MGKTNRWKFRIDISYIGTAYCGWQPQPREVRPSVYDVVAAALAVAGRGRLGGAVAAGRTDKGVHARHQVLSGRTYDDPTADADGGRARCAALHAALDDALPDSVLPQNENR